MSGCKELFSFGIVQVQAIGKTRSKLMRRASDPLFDLFNGVDGISDIVGERVLCEATLFAKAAEKAPKCDSFVLGSIHVVTLEGISAECLASPRCPPFVRVVTYDSYQGCDGMRQVLRSSTGNHSS
jgi:hypothetical protein